MWVSKDRKVTLQAPADYNRSLIPGGYYITPGVARIPLDCHNGVALAFTESNNPRNVPANLVMEFSDQTIAANGWSLPRLVEICMAVIGSFARDYATLYDEAHRARPGYHERLFDYDMRRVPTGLYWLNYYSRDWVANIGEERLRKLSSHVAMEQSLPDGGVLIALQEESYDETNPAHKDRQLYLEQEIFDLPGYRRGFPTLVSDPQATRGVCDSWQSIRIRAKLTARPPDQLQSAGREEVSSHPRAHPPRGPLRGPSPTATSRVVL